VRQSYCVAKVQYVIKQLSPSLDWTCRREASSIKLRSFKKFKSGRKSTPPSRGDMVGRTVDFPVERLAAAVDTGASERLVGTAEYNLSKRGSEAVPVSNSRNPKPRNDLVPEVNLCSDGHLVGSNVTLLQEKVAPTVRFLDGPLTAVQTVEKAGNRASLLPVQDWRLDEAFACVRQGRPARSQERNPRKATRSDCADWRKKETAGSGPDLAQPASEQILRPDVSGDSLPKEDVSECKGEDKHHKKKSQVRHHE
jgi:hypothetical protein